MLPPSPIHRWLCHGNTVPVQGVRSLGPWARAAVSWMSFGRDVQTPPCNELFLGYLAAGTERLPLAKGSKALRGGPGTTVPSALPCPGSIYIGLRNPKEALQRHEKAMSWTSFIPTALIHSICQWPVLGKHSQLALLNATSRAGLKLCRLGQPACAVPIYSFPYGMPGARQPLCPSYGVYTFP